MSSATKQQKSGEAIRSITASTEIESQNFCDICETEPEAKDPESPAISSLTARASDSIAVRIMNDNFVQLTFGLTGIGIAGVRV